MYVFKSLNSQDIIVSPLEASKDFYFVSDEFTRNNVQIDRFMGSPIDDPNDVTGFINQYSKFLIYSSIKQLYFSNYISGSNGQISKANIIEYNLDGTTTGSFYSTLYENYVPTTLNPQRNFPKNNGVLGVISIPKFLYGDHIQPKSVSIQASLNSFFDNGEGVLLINRAGKSYPVGNVIYEHGLIILCENQLTNTGTPIDDANSIYGEGIYGGSYYGVDSTPVDSIIFTEREILDVIEGTDTNIAFKNSYTIFETQYKCTIDNNEFNISQNPTLLDSKDGKLKYFATGSYFNPYITTVGLYNDQKELLAVAKMTQPLPTSNFNDLNIIIKLDRL